MKDSASAIYRVEPESARAREDEVPRGYKRTEVGVIPDDWSAEPLGLAGKFLKGQGIRKDDAMSGAIPCVRYGEIYTHHEEVIRRFNSFISADVARFATLLKPGSLLFAGSGETKEEIGKAVAYLGPVPAYAGGDIIIFVPASINPTFLGYALNAPVVASQKASLGQGDAIVHITASALSEVRVPVPSIKSEQEAIAEALGDADALIESLQQLIAKKRATKQGAMQALLTGRQRLPGFTGGWQSKRLDDLFSFSGGFSASRDQLGAEGCCYLHYGDIHTSSKSFVDVCSGAANIPKLDIALNRVPGDSMLDDGDVVFVDASEDEEGTSKHIVVSNPEGTPFISGLHTIVAKATSDDLVHAYRQYCFQTDAVKAQFRFFAVGTKVLGVSKSNIGKIELRFPTREEQTAIASILSDMDAEIEALEARLAKTRALKTGMMQALLTGRIRLVRPAMGSVLPKEKTKLQVAGAASHNKHFNEAVVIGVLARCFGSEAYPLGRFRRTKLAYLLHRHWEGYADGFMKKAAGPYDPGVRYGGAEAIALKSGYVKKSRKKKGEGFVAGDQIATAEGYFRKWYGADVLEWLEQFRKVTNEGLELLTTVDMAVVELKEAGKRVDVVGVKDILRTHKEWQPKLGRALFSDRNIARAIDRCKRPVRGRSR